MQDSKIVYENLKRLKSTSEWKVFEKHIIETIALHRDAALSYIGKDKNIDAQRQYWMSEGLLEAVDEPKRFIETYENNPVNFIKGKAKKIQDYLKKI